MDINSPSCPVPNIGDQDVITLAHGEGGKLMRRLIRDRILSTVGNEFLSQLGDATLLPEPKGQHVVTTDSYVVSPLFFPGGDIGSLSVFGSVNDLVAAGAKPLWLSLALIIEEGLPITTLDRIIQSIATASQRSNVQIVTGDTKVVPRGAADGLFINTTGIGELISPQPIGPCGLKPMDQIIATGPIGQHGIAVLTEREGLKFDPSPTSDSAPLIDAAAALHDAGITVRAMRDATRGGVAAVLHEWSEECGLTLTIEESNIPLTPEVRGACELLGLDPIHVACEGTMLVAVDRGDSERAITALKSVSESSGAAIIGEARSKTLAPVTVRRVNGQEIPIDEPLGAALPRIC